MTSPLDAPLRPVRRPDIGLQKRKPRFVTALPFFFVAAVALAANYGLNMFADPKPETRIASLPEDEAAANSQVARNEVTGTVPSSAPEPANVQNGVQIVYGTDGQPGGSDAGGTAAPAPPLATTNAPVPQPRPDGSTERFLSPGGAKIITLAPSAPSVGQPLEVAHLPEDAALEELGEGLLLPQISPDGRRPMDIYARPWSGGGGKRIAIMIGGIGLSQTSSQMAIEKLPPEITLGFSPAGNSLSRWMRAARKKGHELVVQVPMEPFNYPQVDPGPTTLRLASSAQTNVERLHASMSSITNYTGVTNYLGARFMANANAVTPIFREIGQRGLLFFNDGTAKAPGLRASADAMGVPYVEADLVIDGSQSPAEIQTRLKALEDLATARGVAIGTGSALGMTIETVSTWANDAKKRGFEIVGVSALAD
ncbi:MAG: divergent polysaccharide deacetylase family protein [Pseudomonadota bacterium]